MCKTYITPSGVYVLDENNNIVSTLSCTTGQKESFEKGITIGVDTHYDAINALKYNKYEEEENMERNKVLDLFVERRRKAIREEYERAYEEEYNALPAVEEFNTIIANFETQLAELVNREATSVEYLGYKNDYGYVLKDSLLQEIKDKHYEVLKEKMQVLDDKANEIHALLSLSDDKDYQIEVLTNYGILDKKTKQITI